MSKGTYTDNEARRLLDYQLERLHRAFLRPDLHGSDVDEILADIETIRDAKRRQEVSCDKVDQLVSNVSNTLSVLPQ